MKTTTKMIMCMGRISQEINADEDEILKDPKAGILLPIWNILILETNRTLIQTRKIMRGREVPRGPARVW